MTLIAFWKMRGKNSEKATDRYSHHPSDKTHEETVAKKL